MSTIRKQIKTKDSIGQKTDVLPANEIPTKQDARDVTMSNQDGPQQQDEPATTDKQEALQTDVPGDDSSSVDSVDDTNKDDHHETSSDEKSDVVMSHDSCPECQKKKRKGNGFPFGRKPSDEVNKKPKAEPKTAWGRWQRSRVEEYAQERAEVAAQIARISYVPVHSDGRVSPKSFDRLVRETYSFLNPRWKTITDDRQAAKDVRDWLEKLLISAILTSERARENTTSESQKPHL